MKLISKQTKIDMESFVPVVELVIQIPLERAQDDHATDPNFYENIGKRFMSIFQEK